VEHGAVLLSQRVQGGSNVADRGLA
jgi:hypothetical protein